MPPIDPLIHPWFRMSDLPPGAAYGIEWRWPGYEVLGATTVDKRGNRTYYALRGKSLERLSFVPDAWRPVPGSRWTWPNGVAPEPIKPQVLPRVAMIGGVAFDATQAALEMESDREAARATQDRDPLDEIDPQWWRDVTQVAYEPMGQISKRMVEARIMRFLALERMVRHDLEPTRTNAAMLVALKRTLADILGEDREVDWVPPLKPDEADHKDFDVVAGWLIEANPDWRQIIALSSRAQAPPVTWDRIGGKIRRTREGAKWIYNTTIDLMHAVANRPPRRAPAQLRKLQERNRAARRRE